jgi:hypothetical protein
MRLAIVAGVVLLALVETGYALVSPYLAPSDQDWREAAEWVKSQHRTGDLLVAAPGWADPVLRLHLGDRLPEAIAGRLDHRSFARVWELSQRGAEASELDDALVKEQRRFGRLRVRLAERQALARTYDFVEGWDRAQVSRVERGGATIPCELQSDQHQCPGLGHNFVRKRILEIGNSLRRALLVQPVGDATVAVEYAQVPLGKELAVGAGLHNVWARKGGDGTVWLRVLIDGKEVGKLESGNRTGWKVSRLDTTAFAGRSGTVRFEVTSARPFSRLFGFAAEARGR